MASEYQRKMQGEGYQGVKSKSHPVEVTTWKGQTPRGVKINVITASKITPAAQTPGTGQVPWQTSWYRYVPSQLILRWT